MSVSIIYFPKNSHSNQIKFNFRNSLNKEKTNSFSYELENCQKNRNQTFWMLSFQKEKKRKDVTKVLNQWKYLKSKYLIFKKAQNIPKK